MFSWLNYGLGGAGKTRMVVETVRSIGGIALDVEGKWTSTVIPYADIHALEAAARAEDYEEFMAQACGKAVFIPPDHTEYALSIVRFLAKGYKATGKPLTPLLVFDGWSEYQDNTSLLIARSRHAESEKVDDMVLDQKGWGKLLVDNRWLMAWMKPSNTGANLYCTAKMREAEDPEGHLLFRPTVRGGFGQDIETYFDLVTPMKQRTIRDEKNPHVERRVYFKPLINATVRDEWEHLNWAPPYMDDPDYLRVSGLLEAAREAEYKRAG
jgi:hypothetical protein